MLTIEQLQQRKKGIGGSDVASIMGLSPWKTALRLWMEKTTDLCENNDSEASYWGNIMEPILRNEYIQRTGHQVLFNNEMVTHSVHKFMIAHVDGIVCDGKDGIKLLEIKTSSAFKSKEWGEQETDELPQYYLTQIHHYLYVYNARECDVVVLIGGNQFKIYNVQRDREMDKILVDVESKFWDCVVNNIHPNIMNTNDWNILHGNTLIDDDYNADDEVAELVADLKESQNESKKLDNHISKVKLEIMQKMNNHKNLCIAGKKVGQIIKRDYLGWDFEAMKADKEIKQKYMIKPTNSAHFQLSRGV